MEMKRSKLLLSGSATLALMLSVPAAFAEPFLPSFANEGQNIVNYPKPEQRWVALPTDVAKMTANRFVLPANTYAYPLAGMTVFPYYQASPELKEFLNNARVNGVPITSLRPTPDLPPNRLVPTDLVRIDVPIPQGRLEKQSSTQMALRNRLHDEVPWMVAHHGGQCFAMPGDPLAIVILSSGSMFNAAAERTVGLRCGTMWVLTGPRPAAVLTKYGAVEIKPYSIAGVEQTWFNRVKIASLWGEPAGIQFAYKGNNRKATIQLGKELSLNESAVASIGTADYVETPASAPTDAMQVAKENAVGNKQASDLSKDSLLASRLPQTVPVSNIDSFSKKIDPDVTHFVAELKGINPPIASPRMSAAYKDMFAKYGITPEMRKDAARDQFLKATVAAAPKQTSTYKASLDARYFVPATKKVKGVVPVAFPHVSESLETLWVQHGVVKYLDNAKLEIESMGRLSINSGEAIFAAKEPMYVRARDCFINIKAGTIVQVKVKKDTIVVRNLRELANNSVLLKVKSRTIECAGGGELIVANNVPAVFIEMKNDGVTRRNVRSIETAGGSVVINKCEIDLTTLMQFNPLMRQICESKDKFDQKLFSEVVKMNAVLTMVTKNHGTYQRISGLPSPH